jgi:hypothetical protein
MNAVINSLFLLQIFYRVACNVFVMDTWLMFNRRSAKKQKNNTNSHTTATGGEQKQKVFVCTTMCREVSNNAAHIYFP